MNPQDNHNPIQPSAFEPLSAHAPQAQRQRHPWRWALGAVALLFLLIMGFLLSARSLQISVQASAPVDIDIDAITLPFGNRYLIRPGVYRVRATAEGYHPLEISVTVTDEDSQRSELVMAPLPGKLDIVSQPSGARVFIDEQHVGDTPLQSLSVEAGTYTLRLQAERYLAHEQQLEVEGRNSSQQFTIALQPGWAEVSVSSTPAGAQILLDGEVAGVTPAKLEVMQGEHQLMLQHPTHADWQQDLEITAGMAQDLGNITLQAAAGLLQLDSQPSGANVTLDGEFQGQTPLELAVSPGRPHRLSLSKPGYRRFSEEISMQAAQRDTRTVRLSARLGEVNFRISPAQATLRINGVPRGTGSQVLSLPAVEQRVEIALDGYATVNRRITPRPGLQQLVEVSLKTEAQARAARIPSQVISALGQTLLLFDPAQSPNADFTMGASRREPGRRANEVLHPVALRRSFYLQTTEVTNAQFRLFDPKHDSGQIEGNSLNRDHQPAVQVSWQQAAAFCNWLSKREGLPPFYRESNGIITGYNPSATGYRLPSEAEWAWAARSNGATLLKFPWGDTFPPVDAVENYADNTSAYVTGRILSGYRDGHVVSAPVGSFPASARGLYDMGGNVAEWVHDVYIIPSANGDTETDPLGAQSGDNYVIRGASWSHSRIGELRLSYRDYGQAGRDDVGFRIARYAE
ncbi:PEGA domain-containing protein [Pseudohalioglobus sediminis]|uniref:PEGA domain-containing protein n=1 Tax=Pseudohalioglobus sediminis TaxID=2606449 RepID=A0A5B0WPY5_9GAMM|nr:PEGA domain-containing protein [Pseudohalioglobus sediminis]KAA1189003.1 PEGA domain-containing protein [Pseudohalioglobus sediminis]